MSIVRVLVLGLVLGCSKHHDAPDTSRFDAVDLASPPGVSDLAMDPRGLLWAIPERDRVLLEISPDTYRISAHPLDGVPDGLDTESVTWVGPGRFAIGTEGEDVASASVLFVEVLGNRYMVTSERPITNAEVGLEMTPNHGAEGICGKGDDLWVAIESRGTLPNGDKWAPLVHLHDGKVETSRLHLTTQTGKLSALWCNGSDAYAIERHYGVHRILHFMLGPGELVPAVAVDLDSIFHGAYNLEGLVRLPSGKFVLVNDNQGHTAEGPTRLFFLR
jgi:SdiA-regulated protein